MPISLLTIFLAIYLLGVIVFTYCALTDEIESEERLKVSFIIIFWPYKLFRAIQGVILHRKVLKKMEDYRAELKEDAENTNDPNIKAASHRTRRDLLIIESKMKEARERITEAR